MLRLALIAGAGLHTLFQRMTDQCARKPAVPFFAALRDSAVHKAISKSVVSWDHDASMASSILRSFVTEAVCCITCGLPSAHAKQRSVVRA